MSDEMAGLVDTGEISPALTNGHVEGAEDRIYCDFCDTWSKPVKPSTRSFAIGWKQMHVKKEHPEHFVKRGESAPAPSNTVKPAKAPVAKKAPVAAKLLPQSRGPRKKADEVIEDIASLAGTALMHTGIDPGVGAVLMAGAPILGADLDELAAGSFVDRAALQPLARLGGRTRELGSVVLLMLTVGAVERKPEIYPQAYPVLRMGAAQLAPGMIRSMRRSITEQKALAEQFAEVKKLQAEMDDLKLSGEDPVEGIIQSFFAHMVPPSPPEPEDAAE